ncbi:lasso peptide biosynthesis B2 protein [Streptomyces pinistramenti]|uniref:lasso peptide biosynthesis B2 protein n=1 Tax=Streptomyces pinistramenti TaxID=2884812 RepID=UPI001D08F35E|nr:lasso peptide biosynthesis B2 protein [Streptomyces pinistramenti]MCB5908458.1 lasso peptide biosynthesis B2 protein [Streptomyces pinistramenti]
MSFPVALPPHIRLGPWQYVLARTTGALAPPISASTSRLKRTLARAQRRARPSSTAETEHAVLAVCTANLRLGGRRACLSRSVAALLYCRAHGHTPALVVGIKPGTAEVHAWLEAEGRPAGEPSDPTRIYTPVTRYGPQEHTRR